MPDEYGTSCLQNEMRLHIKTQKYKHEGFILLSFRAHCTYTVNANNLFEAILLLF